MALAQVGKWGVWRGEEPEDMLRPLSQKERHVRTFISDLFKCLKAAVPHEKICCALF